MLYKISILKNLSGYRRKHLRWSLVFNKFTDFQPATLFTKKLQHRCFHVNFSRHQALKGSTSKIRFYIETIMYL